MLTDTKLKSLKPQDKLYKVADRDGLYVAVSPACTLTFRLDYRLNGRRETLTIGRYGPAGLTLAEARERCLAARKDIAQGKSPAREKQRGKQRLREAKTFGEFTVR
ncbi:Arm DNA-binding domain-containing protein [Laribacter hongkongensis]|uniref:Arm DNA-binding domain-containing protein n=1 Tax=Laribacter hongkongensis TaxID=168471 RepID=UPI00402B667D